MSEAAAMYLLIAAIVGATGAIFGALLWLVKPRFEDAIQKVVSAELAPIFKQLTENSHMNLIPTIPDLISNVQSSIQLVLVDVDRLDGKVETVCEEVTGIHTEVDTLKTEFERHLVDREESKQLMRTIEAIALSKPPPDLQDRMES